MRPTKHKHIIYIILGGLLCFGFYLATATFCLHDMREAPTFKHMSTKKLIHKYDNASLDHLIEKVIEINGTLKAVHSKNNTYTLYLSHLGSKTYVLCELQNNQNHKIKQLKVGDNIVIKGILKGHLLDIILLNCIII
jgi:hypothetical protein